MMKQPPSKRRRLFLLPCDNFVYKRLLLAGSSAEIYTGGFNTFMSHKISKQSDIIILFEKILCIAMTEGMRINHLFIKTIFVSIIL